MKFCLLIFYTFLFSASIAQSYEFKKVDSRVSASFRGLSVVDNQVAWLGGTKGHVGRTRDGGKTWQFIQVKAFEATDFRSIYGFDSLRAIAANAGSPAHILRTIDGGKSWQTVYTNSHADAFFDGIDFWNDKEGLIYGDPIDGRMLLLRTLDGGITWSEIEQSPLLEKGEASFAASGTGIRCLNKKSVMICTGGVVSRVWTSADRGNQWTSIATPILQVESATGIFSFTKTKNTLVIVGGDYQKENQTIRHHYYSTDNGKNWNAPTAASRGYRECVEALSDKAIITVGPSGSDISYDMGVTWKAHSDEKGLHVIRKARKGTLTIAAGSNGQVFLLEGK